MGVKIAQTSSTLIPLNTKQGVQVTTPPANNSSPSVFSECIKFANNSERVSIEVGKNLRVVSLPNSMYMGKIITSSGEKMDVPLRREFSDSPSDAYRAKDKKTVAIIDNFRNQKHFVGGNKALPHGDIVGKIATAGLEDKVDVLAIDVSDKWSGDVSSDDLCKALKYLVETQKSGTKIDALNISMVSKAYKYKELSDLCGKEITECNVRENRDFIISSIKGLQKGSKQSGMSKEAQEALKFLSAAEKEAELLEELANGGTEIFVAAGNDGFETFPLNNLFYSERIHIVGASDEKGKPEEYSCKNPFGITNWARGAYTFEPEFDKTGWSTGFVKSGEVSFRYEDIGGWNGKNDKTIRGTSFASAAATRLWLERGLKESEGSI